MAIRKIVRFPQNFLRQPTKAVDVVDAAVRRLVDDMCETMFAAEGAGLAAIQVGASERIFIIDPQVAGRQKNDPALVLINPVIEHLTPETHVKDEGCLSFPGIFVPVKRSIGVRVRAMDLDGQSFVIEASDATEGLFARALQHEHDHLINKLLIDQVGPVKRQMIKRKLERMTDEEAERLIMEHGD